MDQDNTGWLDAVQIYATDDGWFVGCSKGVPVGPFDSRDAAELHSRTLPGRVDKAGGLVGIAERVRRLLRGGRGATDPAADAAETPAGALAPAKPRPGTAPGKRTLPRAGEPHKTWFRTDRVVNQNGAWFITTREGIDVGPYDNLTAAQRDARRLIRMLERQADADPQEKALTIRQFLDRPTAPIRYE